jgi:hypothetical protein
MERSKFSPTSLSEMKVDDVKNSYCFETTGVHIKEWTIPTLLKLIGVGTILSFIVSLFKLSAAEKSLKKLPWEVHFR